MKLNLLGPLGLGLLIIPFTASVSSADGRSPASLLVYPEFDNRPGRTTLLSVSNTNSESVSGAVRVEFVYVNGSGPAATLCNETHLTVSLSPNDTLSVLSSAHNPNAQRGYVYAFAKDVQGSAISFDALIGADLILDGAMAFEYSVNPLAFRAIAPEGAPTDVDGDGIRDLDGVEYEMCPARMLVPRFMGQSAIHQSDLILIGLSGGKQFTTLVDFLVYNDNEEVLSSNYSFRCWAKVPLASISNIFDLGFLANMTADDPAEILGAPATEAGWFEIDGSIANSSTLSIADPAFLAVLSERTGARAGAELSFEEGRQANGDLLPFGLNGDGN